MLMTFLLPCKFCSMGIIGRCVRLCAFSTRIRNWPQASTASINLSEALSHPVFGDNKYSHKCKNLLQNIIHNLCIKNLRLPVYIFIPLLSVRPRVYLAFGLLIR